MDIEIIYNHDNLNRERFVFCCRMEYSGIKFVLDEFHMEQRETTRHKFKAIKQYYRLERRRSNLNRDDIVLPDDIIIQVIDKIKNSINFVYEF